MVAFKGAIELKKFRHQTTVGVSLQPAFIYTQLQNRSYVRIKSVAPEKSMHYLQVFFLKKGKYLIPFT